jgi:hypothetical protein
MAILAEYQLCSGLSSIDRSFMTLPNSTSTAQQQGRWQAAFEVLAILAVFYLAAGWAPPDVNEAHYLSKAKHYWNPAWCQNDFFCNSADAHQVFYWTFGWLTRWLSLTGAAWVGRAATWTMLAIGWRHLSTALAQRRFMAVLTAALFVTFNTQSLQLAGEWVVGGVEAKGPAYGLVFFGLGELVRGRWASAWLLLGAATAFHVLVGGWSLVAAGVAWLVAGSERPTLLATLRACAMAVVIALPGVAPALALTSGADRATVAQANQIYVFERLVHHLAFSAFPWQNILSFAGVLVVFCFFAALGPRGPEERRLRWFVGGALAIAVCGVLIENGLRGQPATAAALLRFYWFRLADAITPAAASLAIGHWLAAPNAASRSFVRLAVLATAILVAGGYLGTTVKLRCYDLKYPGPIADWSLDEPEAWWEVCDWVRENTPENAVFMVPRMAATFRWRTNRAEVANWKDIPQDARSLLAWRERIRDLYERQSPDGNDKWRSLNAAGAERLIELGKKYGAEYVVTSNYTPLPLKRVNPPNPVYAVYRLPTIADSNTH